MKKIIKCHNCGAEIPIYVHKGLTPRPEHYIVSPLTLTPGQKYDRRFSLLFLPPKLLEGGMYLGSALVIASEEIKKDGSGEMYVAGSKFYDNEIPLLTEAVNRTLAAEIAFTCVSTDRELHSVLNSRLRALYESRQMRDHLVRLSTTMLRNMEKALGLADQKETT